MERTKMEMMRDLFSRLNDKSHSDAFKLATIRAYRDYHKVISDEEAVDLVILYDLKK